MNLIDPAVDNLLMDLLRNKIPITLRLDEDNTIVYSVPGFYKSGAVELKHKEGNTWFVHQRYNEVDEVECLYDLALVNFRWWSRSKDRSAGWKDPDPYWLDILIQFGMVKKKVTEVVEYVV